MSARRLRTLAATFGVVAGLLLVACGAKSTTSGGTSSATTVTTVTTPVPVTTAATIAPSSTDAAIDQQIQDLSSALSQVNGDVASADKAAANGG